MTTLCLYQKMISNLIQKEPFDAKGFKKEYGVKSFVGNKNCSLMQRRALVSGVTCNIAGIELWLYW